MEKDEIIRIGRLLKKCAKGPADYRVVRRVTDCYDIRKRSPVRWEKVVRVIECHPENAPHEKHLVLTDDYSFGFQNCTFVIDPLSPKRFAAKLRDVDVKEVDFDNTKVYGTARGLCDPETVLKALTKNPGDWRKAVMMLLDDRGTKHPNLVDVALCGFVHIPLRLHKKYQQYNDHVLARGPAKISKTYTFLSTTNEPLSSDSPTKAGLTGGRKADGSTASGDMMGTGTIIFDEKRVDSHTGREHSDILHVMDYLLELTETGEDTRRSVDKGIRCISTKRVVFLSNVESDADKFAVKNLIRSVTGTAAGDQIGRRFGHFMLIPHAREEHVFTGNESWESDAHEASKEAILPVFKHFEEELFPHVARLFDKHRRHPSLRKYRDDIERLVIDCDDDVIYRFFSGIANGYERTVFGAAKAAVALNADRFLSNDPLAMREADKDFLYILPRLLGYNISSITAALVPTDKYKAFCDICKTSSLDLHPLTLEIATELADELGVQKRQIYRFRARYLAEKRTGHIENDLGI
jgi:hypothetical protein